MRQSSIRHYAGCGFAENPAFFRKLLDEALEHPAVNIVSVCTEHHRQGRVAIRCAEAGKHIYIDKPMAGSLQEARKLEAIVRKKNLRSQMFTQVLMPPAQRAKRLLASGVLGELRALHHDLHFSKGYSKDLALKPRGRDIGAEDVPCAGRQT